MTKRMLKPISLSDLSKWNLAAIDRNMTHEQKARLLEQIEHNEVSEVRQDHKCLAVRFTYQRERHFYYRGYRIYQPVDETYGWRITETLETKGRYEMLTLIDKLPEKVAVNKAANPNDYEEIAPRKTRHTYDYPKAKAKPPGDPNR